MISIKRLPVWRFEKKQAGIIKICLKQHFSRGGRKGRMQYCEKKKNFHQSTTPFPFGAAPPKKNTESVFDNFHV